MLHVTGITKGQIAKEDEETATKVSYLFLCALLLCSGVESIFSGTWKSEGQTSTTAFCYGSDVFTYN